MNTYILLFRGINVGGKNLLPMKGLKALLEEDGYEGVETYIQSGNVVLRGRSLSVDNISSKIGVHHGFRPKVMALGVGQLADAIKNNPFEAPEGKSIHFYFCSDKPDLKEEKLASLAGADEVYQLKGNVFYLYAPSGIGRSKLVANIEACLGVAATGRNLNTVRRVHEMARRVEHESR